MTSPYAGMTAVVYARCSTKDRDQDPEMQLAACRGWCRDNGVLLCGEYTDRISGGSLDDHPRPQLDAMLGRIMHGDINILLAWKDDRLSRDLKDKTWLLNAIRPYHTVVRYVTDCTAPETASGQLADLVGTWKAHRELADDSLRIRAGIARARTNGTKSGHPIGRAPAEVDLDMAMECARAGRSIAAAARILHVSRETLRQRLQENGMLDRFYETAGATQATRLSGTYHTYCRCNKPCVQKNPSDLNSTAENP